VLFEESQPTSGGVTLFTAAVSLLALGGGGLLAARDGKLASALPGLALGGIVLVGVLVVLTRTRLETRVTTTGVTIALRPFKTVALAPGDIAGVSARQFGLFSGGIGYHVGLRSMALTARTGDGIVITRPDGRTLLVGTQRPDALLSALMQLQRAAPAAGAGR
jgi:hypothetical protein